METGCRGWAKSSLLRLLHPCPLAAVTWGVQGRGLDSTGDRTSSHWHSLIISDVIHDVIIWGQAGTGAAGLLLGRGFLLYLDHLGLKPRPQGVVTHVHVLINLQEANKAQGTQWPGGTRVKDLGCETEVTGAHMPGKCLHPAMPTGLTP